ncbi:hypothetical protein [Clostridium paridis]|uniref:Uncharacterized protein n=1 Tax=Clostridium paridis TaxID=2803863 RepID=A0A937K631_9CLOT|nr:hypothetical protein [Clostridium paridis]MBL4933120.1 hypothetical protein [Clostridium paridis]
MKRYITFNDDGVVSSKMFITKEVEEGKEENEGNILEYEKCLYTIVEDGLDYKNVMEDTFKKFKEWVYLNDYKVKGEGIIGMLLIEHFHEKARSYLEVYIPIE